MFPFDDSNFDGSDFSGFNFDGFDFQNAKPTYLEFDNNSTGNWSGGVNAEYQDTDVQLDQFGLGPATYPESCLQGPSGFRAPITTPSYWDAAGPYEGSTVLPAIASTTLSNPFETTLPPVDGLAGTGKPHHKNPYRFVRQLTVNPGSEHLF